MYFGISIALRVNYALLFVCLCPFEQWVSLLAQPVCLSVCLPLTFCICVCPVLNLYYNKFAFYHLFVCVPVDCVPVYLQPAVFVGLSVSVILSIGASLSVYICMSCLSVCRPMYVLPPGLACLIYLRPACILSKPQNPLVSCMSNSSYFA